MSKRKLTKAVVDALEKRASDYVEWCGALPGFGCRVRPSGSRSLIVQYRVGGRNSPVRKVTLGSYGKLTVEQARKAAEAILAKAELGIDEAGERARKRGELTVAELCDEYLTDGCDRKKASTIATDKGRIERHIKPLLGRKRIGDVTRGDIERFMRDVANGKTAADVKTKKFGRARVTGGKGTATRTVRLLGGIFSYAVARDYISANPRSGVRLYEDGKGERFLSEEELRRLGEALREAETAGLPWQPKAGANVKHVPKMAATAREIVSPHAIAAIRLLMLTGCRAGEILNLQWKHVDLEHGLLNLADSKTGAKPVLLGAPAMKVLADIPRISGNPYVIVGDKPKLPRRDLKRPWSRIIKHAGLDGLRLHDLRHSFASVGAASGMGLTVVGKLLGHQSTSTTARYSHLADDPLRRASDAIAGRISDAMGDGAAGEVADVVQLRGQG